MMIQLMILLASLVSTTTFAGMSGLRFTVEPIVGYESVQKLIPTTRRSTRLFYGGRVTAGFLLLSAEGEYTKANDTETFSNPARTIAESADKLKIGLRSTFKLTSMLSFSARGGAQATQLMRDTTQGSTTTRTWDPIVWRPYGGAGLRAQLAPKIYASAEMVVVWSNFPDMNTAEYQPTVGVHIAFP